ncbi:MAG: phosphatase PAP2 family protein [Bacilli bacterium]|nr:phosphatase PAP2 family protein [Bacilli bacterium]
MKSNKKKFIIISIILLGLSIIYTLLVKYIDVKAIGPLNSKVGFATLNKFVKGLLPYNETFYKVSKYAGILPFGFVGIYGLMGLINLIKSKGFKKMDKRYLVLGLFYLIFVCIYIFFENVVINYRPVLKDMALEASYPSTHTLLAICLCGTSLLVSKNLIKDKTFKILFDIAAWILMITIVVTRVLSGVHWASDIIGGIILSLTYLSFFKCSLLHLYERELTIA